MPKCSHEQIKTIATRPFSGSVASPKSPWANPMAHGNIVERQECQQCKARRSVAINGRHEEVGTWSTAHLAAAEKAKGEAVKASIMASKIKPLRVQLEDGRVIELSVDDGGIVRYPAASVSRETVIEILDQNPEWYAASVEVYEAAQRAKALAEESRRLAL